MTSLILNDPKQVRTIVIILILFTLVICLNKLVFNYENRIVGNWQITKAIISDSTISNTDSTNITYSFKKDSTIEHTGLWQDRQRWFVKDDTLNWVFCHLGCDTMQYLIEDFSGEKMILDAVFHNDLKVYLKRIKNSP